MSCPCDSDASGSLDPDWLSRDQLERCLETQGTLLDEATERVELLEQCLRVAGVLEPGGADVWEQTLDLFALSEAAETSQNPDMGLGGESPLGA